MAIGLYISIITLNANRILQLKDTDWLNRYKNKIHTYILPAKDPLQI